MHRGSMDDPLRMAGGLPRLVNIIANYNGTSASDTGPNATFREGPVEVGFQTLRVIATSTSTVCGLVVVKSLLNM